MHERGARNHSAQGVPSYKTRSTFHQLFKGMKNLEFTLAEVAPQILVLTNVISLTTLVNEHLHSSMRQRDMMPTHLEFAHAFLERLKKKSVTQASSISQG